MCWSDRNGKKSLEPEFCKVPNDKFKRFAVSLSMNFDLVWKMSAGAFFCLAGRPQLGKYATRII
jgi:hypothetical protein